MRAGAGGGYVVIIVHCAPMQHARTLHSERAMCSLESHPPGLGAEAINRLVGLAEALGLQGLCGRLQDTPGPGAGDDRILGHRTSDVQA